MRRFLFDCIENNIAELKKEAGCRYFRIKATLINFAQYIYHTGQSKLLLVRINTIQSTVL